MNHTNVTIDPMPAILRAIDEIAFHSSILALNAAVAAAGQSPQLQEADAQAARETLALIEESMTRSPHRPVEISVPVLRIRPRQVEAGTESPHRVEEEIRRIGATVPLPQTRRAASRNPGFEETR